MSSDFKRHIVGLDVARRMGNIRRMSNKSSSLGVIFDLDGVLVDTGWAHRQSWFDLAEKEGFTMSDEFFYSTFGMQNYMIIPMVTGRELSRDEVDRMSNWKEQRYREIIAEHLEPAEGAEVLLKGLKGTGFRMAVGSSAPRANLDLVLGSAELRDYFDACISGEQVEHGKPAPDGYLAIIRRMGLHASTTAVVEDSGAGIRSGRAAGTKVVAVPNEHTNPGDDVLALADVRVETLHELPQTPALIAAITALGSVSV